VSLATNNESWSSYEVTDGAMKKIRFLTVSFNRNFAKLIAMTSTKPHGIVTQSIKCQSKTCKDETRPALFLIFVLFYVFLFCSMYFFVLWYVFLCCVMYFCVVLCIFVLFYIFSCCSMYFCVVLCIFVLVYVLFVLCRSLHCLYVYVYCTTATGWLPNYS
jgi:hypothetical protein